jgi:hypothetical protein
MKVLNLNMFFELPKDFEGDLPDALNELAGYLRTKEKKVFGRGPAESPLTWDKFLEALGEGYRVLGDFGMNEWDDEADKWVPLEDK